MSDVSAPSLAGRPRRLPAAIGGSAPLRVQLSTLAVVVIPLLATTAARWIVWGWGFGWTDRAAFAGMYLLTAIGITVGFHRHFSHRSFETYPWVKFALAVAGSMAIQGALFRWVSQHRLHHHHSDRPQDPHTPHHSGEGVLGVLAGVWHAHVGWFFRADSYELSRYVKDLRSSASLRVADALFPLWIAVSFLIPAAFGGLVAQNWAGAITGLIWGGLVRVFLVHHVTWSVNSACHMWGLRLYRSGDMSRDNPVFGVLALGEGWHNSHHAFPTSARHGLRWWQIDVSYWVIRALAALGLAWDLKLPSAAALARKRLRA